MNNDGQKPVPTNKENFLNEFYRVKEQFGSVTKVVVAVKLPTGATELIINTEQIDSKVEYYSNAYDEEMKLKNNPNIQIVGYLFA